MPLPFAPMRRAAVVLACLLAVLVVGCGRNTAKDQGLDSREGPSQSVKGDEEGASTNLGLPLIATRNAGGEDLIVEGKTGFLVPTGDPAAIAEKVLWFLQNRAELPAMSVAARAKAAELTWPDYGEKILHAIRD